MDLPLVGYDPYLNDLMVKSCEDAIAARASNISQFRVEVENIIVPLLPHAEAQAKTVAQRIELQREDFRAAVGSRGIKLWRNPRPDATRTRRTLSRTKPSSFGHHAAPWLPAAQRLQPCVPTLDRQEPFGVSARLANDSSLTAIDIVRTAPSARLAASSKQLSTKPLRFWDLEAVAKAMTKLGPSAQNPLPTRT